MAQSQQQSGTKPNLPPPSNRTLVQSWTALPPRTRLIVSAGVCVFAITGLMVSDYMEKTAIQVKAEKAEKERDLATSKGY